MSARENYSREEREQDRDQERYESRRYRSYEERREEERLEEERLSKEYEHVEPVEDGLSLGARYIREQFDASVEQSRLELLTAIYPLRSRFDDDVDDEEIKRLYNVWADLARAQDKAKTQTYYDPYDISARREDANRGQVRPALAEPMPPLPPKDKEHYFCRLMWSVTIERQMYSDDTPVVDLLETVLLDMMDTTCWYEHDTSCACYAKDLLKWWTSKEAVQLIQNFRTYFSFAKVTGITIFKLNGVK